jgi:exodeoxyribonuclease VII small subunit
MAARIEPGPSDDAGSDGAGSDGAGSDGAEFADVAELSYEDARDELTAIVAQLEGGQVPLEEGMRLWRRGEALAAHCTAWLDGAQRQISEAGPT